MKNKKNAAIYGVGGAVAGYAISHFAKTSKKVTIGLVLGLAIIGAVVGNNS